MCWKVYLEKVVEKSKSWKVFCWIVQNGIGTFKVEQLFLLKVQTSRHSEVLNQNLPTYQNFFRLRDMSYEKVKIILNKLVDSVFHFDILMIKNLNSNSLETTTLKKLNSDMFSTLFNSIYLISFIYQF